MAYSAIIIDNFYDNPDDVRDFALQQDFNIDGNYPGHRTQAFLSPSIKNWIAHHLKGVHGEPIWPEEGDEEYCGAFQYTIAEDRTWIHSDGWNNWAGVCYLTPDAPITGGTGIYRHKETGIIACPRLENGEKDFDLLDKLNADGQDYTKWELVDSIGNVYNRLVLYPGDLFHASLDYFGKDLETGRLFQTFFFNTEK